jgi:hypothetical protein
MLNLDLKYLFDLYGEQFVNDLIKRLNEDGSNTTGKGAKSLSYKSTETGFTISGKKYLGALSDGLKPSQFKNQDNVEGAPSPRNLEEWVKRKVAVGADAQEIKRLSFAISRAIWKKGTIKSKEYQGTDFIDFVINKNTGSLVRDVAQETVEQIGTALEMQVKREYKNVDIK